MVYTMTWYIPVVVWYIPSKSGIYHEATFRANSDIIMMTQIDIFFILCTSTSHCHCD